MTFEYYLGEEKHNLPKAHVGALLTTSFRIRRLESFSLFATIYLLVFFIPSRNFASLDTWKEIYIERELEREENEG